MTFIFKIILSLVAIIFIVDKCGACGDETAIEQGDLKPINRNDFLRTNNIAGSQVILDRVKRYNDFITANGMESFLSEFVDGYNEYKSNVTSRYGDGSPGPIDTVIAQCEPELQTVEIVHTDDPTILYVPRCTRLEKCRGSCINKTTGCEATKTEIVSLEVIKYKILPTVTKSLGKEIWNGERDVACKCQCNVKESDCTPMQAYHSFDCACVCKNREDYIQCTKESATKIWNYDKCQCELKPIIGGHPHIPQERAYGLTNERDLKIPPLK